MFHCPGWRGTPISHTSCIQRVQAPRRGGDHGTRGAAQRPLPPAGGTSAARRTREHGAAAGELRVTGARPGPTGSQHGDACVAVGGQPPAPCPGAARDPAGWASLSGCSGQASRRTGRDRHAREATSPPLPSRGQACFRTARLARGWDTTGVQVTPGSVPQARDPESREAPKAFTQPPFSAPSPPQGWDSNYKAF